MKRIACALLMVFLLGLALPESGWSGGRRRRPRHGRHGGRSRRSKARAEKEREIRRKRKSKKKQSSKERRYRQREYWRSLAKKQLDQGVSPFQVVKMLVEEEGCRDGRLIAGILKRLGVRDFVRVLRGMDSAGLDEVEIYGAYSVFFHRPDRNSRTRSTVVNETYAHAMARRLRACHLPPEKIVRVMLVRRDVAVEGVFSLLVDVGLGKERLLPCLKPDIVGSGGKLREIARIIGLNAEDFARACRVFGIAGVSRIAGELRRYGAAAAAAMRALQAVGVKGASRLAQLLLRARYSPESVANALKAVFHYSDTRIADILREAGVKPGKARGMRSRR